MRIAASIPLLLVCMTASGQQQRSSQDVVVEFKPSTSDAEARWIARSYNEGYSFHPSKTSQATLSGMNAETLAKAESIFLQQLKTDTPEASVVQIEQDVSSPNKFIFNLGNSRISPTTRQNIQEHLPPDVQLSWDVQAAYVITPATREETTTLMRLLRDEPSVKRVYNTEAPIPSAVESAGTISLPPEPTKLGLPHKPIEIELTSLPKPTVFIDILHSIYSSKGVSIVLQKEDIDKRGEWFIIAVSHVRGSITNPPFWEKFRYSFPIYQSSEREIKVRCVLEGEYATGMGNREPASEFYRSLEPRYTSELQAQADRVMAILGEQMRAQKAAKK